jgi:ABC-type transport system substrate-binding protein
MNSKVNMSVILFGVILSVGCSNVRVGPHEDETGPPVRGGTLEFLSSGDFDHLATTSAGTVGSMGLLRAFARTLVTYPASTDFETVTRLRPDLALEVPSTENSGISADGRTYTFHLRRGIRWDTNPPREVTAYDFVRAFKLLGNPVCPASTPAYYTDIIEGLEDYCSRFAKVPGTVPAIREFVNTQEIEGVRAADDFTLVFRLWNPALHFLDILAIPCVAPVPFEYLDFLPDSPEFRQHTLSIGPYRITRYIQNREMLLERNPIWDPGTDPIRPGYVDRIRFRFGIDDQLQQLQIKAGTADLGFEKIPTAELAALMAIKDPTVWLSPPGDKGGFSLYLDINQVGPKDRSPTRQLRVRRAIALAVDKAALVQLSGGPRLARALRQAVPSSVTGYRKGADQYVTPGDRGRPAEAREMLAAVGYPNGITLRMAHIGTGAWSLLAQSLQASLARAGITIELMPMTGADFWGRLLAYPENAKRGEWDLALDGASPPWYSSSNGGSMITPLFDGRHFGRNSWNSGGYSNPEVNTLIDRATIAGSAGLAEQAWSKAVQLAMEDVAILPLFEAKLPLVRSRRLRNCTWGGLSPNCDITSVWLADAAPK